MFCNHCGARVSPRSMFCSNCGSAQGDSNATLAAGPLGSQIDTKRQGVLRPILIGFALTLVAVLGIAGLFYLHSLPVRQAALARAANPKRAVNGTYLDRKSGVRVTIAKVTIDASGDSFFKPGRNMVFALFYVRLDNTGDRGQDINPLDFQILDQGSQSYDTTTFLPTQYTQLNATGVPAGQVRAGWIGAEIPATTQQLTVTWDDASRLDPPVTVGKYRVTRAERKRQTVGVRQLTPAQIAVATAVYGFQDALHDIYSPQYSVSILGDTTVGVAAQAVYCTATGLSNQGAYLTYDSVNDRFESIAVGSSTATAVVHISENVTDHRANGTQTRTHDSYTSTYSLALFPRGWLVNNYSWVGDDGSRGGASRDARCGSTG